MDLGLRDVQNLKLAPVVDDGCQLPNERFVIFTLELVNGRDKVVTDEK